jgi:hypothetical protein
MAQKHQDIADLDQETRIQLVIDQLHANSALSHRGLVRVFSVHWQKHKRLRFITTVYLT